MIKRKHIFVEERELPDKRVVMSIGEMISTNQDTIRMALVAAVIIVVAIGLCKSVGKVFKFALKIVIVAAAILLVICIYRKLFVPV